MQSTYDPLDDVPIQFRRSPAPSHYSLVPTTPSTNPQAHNLQDVESWASKLRFTPEFRITKCGDKQGVPIQPSYYLHGSQRQTLQQVFLAKDSDLFHHVVFCAAHRDRVRVKGRRGPKVFPCPMDSPPWSRHFRSPRSVLGHTSQPENLPSKRRSAPRAGLEQKQP